MQVVGLPCVFDDLQIEPDPTAISERRRQAAMQDYFHDSLSDDGSAHRKASLGSVDTYLSKNRNICKNAIMYS
jgi:hypothetical protein